MKMKIRRKIEKLREVQAKALRRCRRVPLARSGVAPRPRARRPGVAVAERAGEAAEFLVAPRRLLAFRGGAPETAPFRLSVGADRLYPNVSRCDFARTHRGARAERLLLRRGALRLGLVPAPAPRPRRV